MDYSTLQTPMTDLSTDPGAVKYIHAVLNELVRRQFSGSLIVEFSSGKVASAGVKGALATTDGETQQRAS
jgi:hypothetical protein